MQSTYIKYKRVHETMKLSQLQDYLDSVVIDGFDIINYKESMLSNNKIIEVIMLLGKKR